MFRRDVVLVMVLGTLFLDQIVADLSDVMFEGLSESDKTECLDRNSISEEEIKTNVDEDVASEDFLCFFKCVSEKRGVLEKDGTINLGHIGECPTIKKLEDDKRVQLIECINGVEKVTKCQDMEIIRKCITAAVTTD